MMHRQRSGSALLPISLFFLHSPLSYIYTPIVTHSLYIVLLLFPVFMMKYAYCRIIARNNSRIIAVDKNGGLILVSPPIPGVVVGTPIVTKGYQSGKFIFVTHNVGTEGHFSVLSVFKDGNIIFTEAAGNNNTEDALTYGPLGVSHNPDYGKYTGGSDTDPNTNDIVTWTTSAEEGFGSPGYTMAFQLPRNFDLLVLEFVELKTVRLKSVSWNAIAKPTLSMDGLSMYIPVKASETRGWVGGRKFDKGASWSTKLESNTDKGNMRKFACSFFCIFYVNFLSCI